MKYLFLIISSFLIQSMQAQQINLQVIDNNEYDMVQLFAYYPNKNPIVQEHFAEYKAKISLVGQKTGFYSLYLINSKKGVLGPYVDLMIENPSDNINLNWNTSTNEVTFPKKSANEKYQTLIKKLNTFDIQQNAIRKFLETCSCDSLSIYKEVQLALHQNEENRAKTIRTYQIENPNNLESKLFALTPLEKKDLKQFWENVPLEDARIYNSYYMRYAFNVLTQKYKGQYPTETDLEIAKRVIENSINHFSTYPEAMLFMKDYAEVNFNNTQMEALYIYTLEQLANQTNCKTEDKLSLEEKIEQSNQLKIGSPFPNLLWKETPKINVEKEKLVIVFYTTYCGHCKEELPRINTWAMNKNETVIGICLDDSKMHDENIFKQWQNEQPKISHYYPTNVEAIRKQYIQYGTPTLYELIKNDKQYIISKKSHNIIEIEKE